MISLKPKPKNVRLLRNEAWEGQHNHFCYLTATPPTKSGRTLVFPQVKCKEKGYLDFLFFFHQNKSKDFKKPQKINIIFYEAEYCFFLQ